MNKMTNKRFTGISQNFRIYRQDNDEEVTNLLGNLSNISYSVQLDNELREDINESPTLREAVDGAAEIYVSIDCEPVSLKATQLVGEYTEDTNAGTWEVELTDHLPEFYAEIQVTNDKTLVIEGIKFNGFTLSVQMDGVVEATFNDGTNGNALKVELEDRELEFDEDVDKPESYLDVTGLIDNQTIGSAESITVEYSRNVQSRRGIQDYEPGERRLPDEITEGNKTFSWDATIQVTDDQAFKTLFNSESYPLTISDYSSKTSFTAQLSEEKGSIELTGGKPTDLGGQLVNDDDIRTIDLSGNGRIATITGELQ